MPQMGGLRRGGIVRTSTEAGPFGRVARLAWTTDPRHPAFRRTDPRPYTAPDFAPARRERLPATRRAVRAAVRARARGLPHRNFRAVAGLVQRGAVEVPLRRAAAGAAVPADERPVEASAGRCARARRVLWRLFRGVRGGARWPACSLYRLDGVGQSVFALGGIFSNNVFLGIPLAKAALGEAAMPSIGLVLVFNSLDAVDARHRVGRVGPPRRTVAQGVRQHGAERADEPDRRVDPRRRSVRTHRLDPARVRRRAARAAGPAGDSAVARRARHGPRAVRA